MQTESQDLVLVEREEGRVALVTLSRPDKLNALDSKVRAGLREVLRSLESDDDVRAVVIRGAGDKAFVAGADISEFAARTVDEQRGVMVGSPRVYDVLRRFPKPVIAAIHGFAIGGGCELALACDVRVADRTARLSQAEIRLGLIPGGGGSQRLPRVVGPGWAAIMCMTGDFVEAEDAHRIGLVDVLVDPGEHVARALELARRMARWSPIALRNAKEAIRTAFETPIDEGLNREVELFLECFSSDDGREGVQAFLDKRKPVFTGS